MKTIFVTSFHPYTARNILATRAFSDLAEKSDVRLVIFTRKYKREYFATRFWGPNVFIEGIDFDFPSRRFSSLLIKRIAKYGASTSSTRIEALRKWRMEGRFFFFIITSFFGIALMRLPFLSPIFRKMMRLIDYRLAIKDRYRPYFESYRPDLVWITDSQNEREVELMHNARRFGVPIVGMVRAWDNLTLHGLLRVLPDLLLVPADKIKEQAVLFNDMKPDKVKVVGVAHYDKYAHGPKKSKEEFLKEIGFSNSIPLILWTPIGDNYLIDNDADPFVFEILGEINAQVLARFSPTVPVKDLDNARPFPNMVFDRPGVNFKPDTIGDQEMSEEDDDRLMHSLYYCDLLIAGPTTVALDAAFIDKPIIIAGLHRTPKKYIEGILRRYDYDHFKFAIDCGAFRVAKSGEEFFKYVISYLKNPSLDNEGRERLRKAYSGPQDGKSGERIANTIIEFLKMD